MDLSEFQYLMNKGYITDVTYAGAILDNYYNGDKSMLKDLTEAQLVEMNLISQPGYVANVHTFTINPTPEDAKVTMKYNGLTLEQNIIIVDHGTDVTWSVEKEGYTKQEETIKVEADEVKDVILEEIEEEIEQVTITFNITPAEATLEVNDEPCPEKSKTVDKGTTLNYTATAEGYDDKTGSVVADSTKEETVTMTKKQYSFTINATPEGATVTINDEQVNTKMVEHGSSVTWSVTKEGFTEQSGVEESVTSEITKQIDLVATSPESAMVMTMSEEPVEEPVVAKASKSKK